MGLVKTRIKEYENVEGSSYNLPRGVEMKSEEIKKLVAKSENAVVEFKRAKGGVPADFWPSYSAFANTDGGDVIFSRRDRRGR